jgi:hypothetical protein
MNPLPALAALPRWAYYAIGFGLAVLLWLLGVLRTFPVNATDRDAGDFDTLGVGFSLSAPRWLVKWFTLPGATTGAVFFRLTWHPDGWDWRPFGYDDAVEDYYSSIGPLHLSFGKYTREQLGA